MNENEDTSSQNVRDAARALLRGKFIPLQEFIRIEGPTQTT